MVVMVVLLLLEPEPCRSSRGSGGSNCGGGDWLSLSAVGAMVDLIAEVQAEFSCYQSLSLVDLLMALVDLIAEVEAEFSCCRSLSLSCGSAHGRADGLIG